MGCFCHASMGPLRLVLPTLNVNASATLGIPGAGLPLGLAAHLNLSGLPCLPWHPDPAWLNLPLPQLRLSARAVATISALAQLHADAHAQFGLNLLIPAQAHAFARIVATLNARLSAVAAMNFNPLGWLHLAQLNSAIDQVNLALRLGLLPPGPHLMLQLNLPGGVPMLRWQSLLALLRLLAPMIAAMAQLNIALTETAQLSATLRVLARLQFPALVAPQFMASLTAALQAVASLQASLGVSPLQLGLPAIQLRIQAKLALLLQALSAQFRINITAPNAASLLAALLALLPPLPLVPTTFATSAVVQAALNARAVASLNWNVNVMPPALHIGLPVLALTAQLQAALNLHAVLKAPCPICDAAALMKALAHAV